MLNKITRMTDLKRSQTDFPGPESSIDCLLNMVDEAITVPYSNLSAANKKAIDYALTHVSTEVYIGLVTILVKLFGVNRSEEKPSKSQATDTPLLAFDS